MCYRTICTDFTQVQRCMRASALQGPLSFTSLNITCMTARFMRCVSWGAQVSYKSYWIRAILEVLHAGRGTMMSIQDVSNVTGIHPGDVREAMGTLQLTQCAPRVRVRL